MKKQRAFSVIVLTLSLPLAGAAWSQQSRPRDASLTHLLRVDIGHLGGDGKIFLSDFATPTQARGLNLLRNGRQAEAAKLFEENLKTDATGVAAVGLAQATPPSQWPAQIKELDGRLDRKRDDVRTQYRLGLLMYYDAISTGIGLDTNYAEFDQAANLMSELWEHTHDPLAGLTLAEMAHQLHSGWKAPRQNTIYETLVGILGGKSALASWQQAKRTHFTGVPPAADTVPEEKRHALAGVLCGLWSNAKSVYSHTIIVDGKPMMKDGKEVWIAGKADPGSVAEAAYLDRWIRTLNPALGKSKPVIAERL